MKSLRNRPVRATALLIVLALLVVILPLPAAAGVSPTPAQMADALAPLSGEAVRGELNSWSTWSMSGSLGGTFIHVTGQISAASDATSEFKFFK
ncbi:MAG TPA: hypothetical protein PKM78_18280, partial [Anaerolineae bacterium]|nr:hypothetical protein [Anaerolineae bacterium]